MHVRPVAATRGGPCRSGATDCARSRRSRPPERLLFAIIRAAFHQRRKQLANNLENALNWPRERVEHLGSHAGIDLRRRGETLTLDEFARLARAAAERDVQA